MFGRILALAVKEFLELWRSRSARSMLILPPVIQMLLFGYAATFEVFGVSTAVLDLDRTQESRELLADFTASHRFQVVMAARDQAEIDRAIDRSDAVIGIVVHAGFARLLRKGETAPVQVIVDGTNSNTALIALGYVNQIAGAFSARYAADLLQRTRPGARMVQVTLEQRPWYNPDMNSRWFFVPGVIGTVTLVMVVNLTAFAIVREREVGTLEQIMVSPIRPVEFILGKTLPFFAVGLGIVLLIVAIGTLWFEVPFAGNPLVLLLGTSLFLLSTLALGLMISTLCTTQQQAFATNFFVLNPIFILSGFSFPIASMPPLLQWLTYADPLQYYLIIIRAALLKGVGLAVLWPQLLGLAVIGGALLAASVLRFRKSID